MKTLSAILYAALCIAAATAKILGPLETHVEIGAISYNSTGDTEPERRAANNIIGLLEYARNMMTVGIDLIVPITEPYKKDALPSVVLDGNIGPLEGKVSLRNLVASGAQQFTINDIAVAFDDKRVDYKLSVPIVEIDVDYEGINLIFDHMFEFSTSGHLHITLSSLDIVGSFCVEPLIGVSDPPYTVVGISVDNIVQTVEVDKDGPTPDMIVDQVKDALMTSVAQVAVVELSDILHHFSKDQVDTFLKG